MKDFCNKILSNQPISHEELIQFIVEYLETMNRIYKAEHLPILVELLQRGMFDMHYAIKEYCKKKQYTHYTLLKDNNVIKSWIE